MKEQTALQLQPSGPQQQWRGCTKGYELWLANPGTYKLVCLSSRKEWTSYSANPLEMFEQDGEAWLRSSNSGFLSIRCATLVDPGAHLTHSCTTVAQYSEPGLQQKTRSP